LAGSGPPTITFQPQAIYPLSPNSGDVAVADFNGDGILDLVIAGGQETSVLPGNGDGTFGTPVISRFASYGGPVSVADFNGDGIPDLAVGEFVLLGNGDGTFWFVTSLTSASGVGGWVAVGDFNGDGKPDVVQIGSLGVSVFTGIGDGTFNPPVGFMSGIGSAFVAVGDFNGDGKPDLAVAGEGLNFSNNVAVLTNMTQ